MVSAAEGSAVRKPEGRFLVDWTGSQAGRQSQSGRASNQGGVREGALPKTASQCVYRLSCGAHRLAGSDWTENGLGWTVDSGRQGSLLGSARADDGWGVPFGEGLFGQVPCLSLPGEVCLYLGVGQEKKR